jgi:amino acid transporter
MTLQMDAHPDAKHAGPAHRESSPDGFRGTLTDRHGMAKLGLKQQTKRYFKSTTMAMFGCAIIATGQVIITSADLVVDSVGTGGLFWGFVLVAAVFSVVYTSIAEMTSIVSSPADHRAAKYSWLIVVHSIQQLADSTHGMLPTDRSPIHATAETCTDRVSMFAPKSCERYLSFETGWLISSGWTSGLVSIASLWTLCIQGLITLHNPTYAPEDWHNTLFIVALLVFAYLFNSCFAKWLPFFEACVAVVSIGGIIIVCLVVWLLLPRNNPRDAFFQFENNTGWNSVGTAFMISLLYLILALLGFDCAVHMCMSQLNDKITITR